MLARQFIFAAFIFAANSLLFNHAVIAGEPIRVATFEVDASPPIGSPLAYDPTVGIQSPLSLRGIVILSEQKPIVIAVVDWLGVANESQTEFRQAMADAAGTTPNRVTLHAVHQHDAPRADASVNRLLEAHGVRKRFYDVPFHREVMERAAKAIVEARSNAIAVTHIGTAEAKVSEVASNRRILGEDGKVKVTRYTATKDPEVRAEPVGTIDPMLKLISFHANVESKKKPVAVLTYYACHPQSYYRTGKASPDFPGIARNARQEKTGTPHIHFNGAGGNIGAGKWNDGSVANRQVLADKVAKGMSEAWKQIELTPIDESSMKWKSVDVVLPAASHLDEKELLEKLKSDFATDDEKMYAAKHLAWLRRSTEKMPVTISCLTIGKTDLLHMPGELFVEYQLDAQKMRPDHFVAMAAYGEYGPGYIGTKIAYSQGGYESSARASRVAPEVEKVLHDAMRTVLEAGE